MNSLQPTISARTTLVGLIGWPVSHSVSPAMHNAAFAERGLNWCYVPLPVDPVRPGAVGDAVRGIRALGMVGVNVTVPHKQAVIPFLDRLEPAAEAMGAVNTIVVSSDGTLLGDNTDAPGWLADLRAHGVEPAGERALVLGAGGSARAVVYGLALAGARQITVANRNLEKASALVAQLAPFLGQTEVAVASWPEGLALPASTATLIVNCTSLGMTPAVERSPWPASLALRADQVVYDLVYNPAQTALLRQAEQQGARPIGGLGMLIWQGALAFERWTGLPAPVARMRGAAEQSLGHSTQQPVAAVRVRRAAEPDIADLTRLHDLLQACHAERLPDFFKPASAPTLSPETLLALLADPAALIWVAEVEGVVAGYLYADTAPALETTTTYRLDRLWIHQLVVAAEYQGRGAGAALVAAARSHAHARAIGTVALSVWAFNERALRFFASQGFETYNCRMWIRSGGSPSSR